MKKENNMMIVWVLIVLIVVALLVFITINKKQEMSENNISATAEQVVKAGDIVSVNYTGMLADGTVFDSNIGKAPLSFTLGAHQVIPGFENGILGMQIGEQKTLVIPPEKAYGEEGIVNPGTGEVIIPPNATLTFEVELLGIKGE